MRFWPYFWGAGGFLVNLMLTVPVWMVIIGMKLERELIRTLKGG